MKWLATLALPLLISCAVDRSGASLTHSEVLAVPEQAAEINKSVEPEEDRCPPLPVLRENASRFEGKLWRETVVALYVQCANDRNGK